MPNKKISRISIWTLGRGAEEGKAERKVLMQETVSASETGSWAPLLGSPEGNRRAGVWGTQLWGMPLLSGFQSFPVDCPVGK